MGIMQEGFANGPAALASYRQALADNPYYDVLYARTAVLYIKQGQNDKAIALMEDACRQNPQSVDACLYLAQIYQALEQPQAAIQAARRAIRIAPANAKGYIQLAYLYIAARDEARARATLEIARKKVSDKLPVLRLMGDLYAQKILETPVIPSPDVAKAIACYEEATVLPPDNAAIQDQERLGDLYLINRQMDKALAIFHNLTTRQPDNMQLHKKLAMCYIALDQKEKAVETLQEVSRREPKNWQIQFYLGELYEMLGNTHAAATSFRNAVANKPSVATPYLKLAAYDMPAEPAKACQTLQNALLRFPDNKKLIEMLITCYLRNQQPCEALASFLDLHNLLLHADDYLPKANAYLKFGDIALQYQMDATAMALYEIALEQEPNMLEAYIHLACLQSNIQTADDALNVMSEAVQVNPEAPMAWYYLGLLNNQARFYPTAIYAFEQAANLAGRSPKTCFLLNSIFYFNYGVACERTGQAARAEALLQQAIQMDSENDEAFNYLAYMWAEKGINLEQALEYSQHALDCDPDNGAFLDTLGWVMNRQKRFTEALECLLAAHYFMPDDPTIMEHIGDTWQALQDLSQALTWWERSYQIGTGNHNLAEKLRQHGVNAKAWCTDQADTPTQP